MNTTKGTMIRKWLILTLLMLAFTKAAFAQWISPAGIVAGFEQYTGIQALGAVVLCESLTVRQEPDSGAPTATTLVNGETFLTWETQDGWLNAHYSDGAEAGWVRSEYVLVDPAYVMTEADTPAYAYDGVDSPRVALLEAGLKLPIIKETGTGYVVALRGAAAFLRK